jgi:hypothetical protein
MVVLLKQRFYMQSIYVLDGKAHGRELSVFAGRSQPSATRFGTGRRSGNFHATNRYQEAADAV